MKFRKDVSLLVGFLGNENKFNSRFPSACLISSPIILDEFASAAGSEKAFARDCVQRI